MKKRQISSKIIGFIDKVLIIFQKMRHDNMQTYSSSSAFFFFLSFVPILIIIGAVIAHTTLTTEDIHRLVLQYIPDALDQAAQRFISNTISRSEKVLPIAILVSIWSAGKGITALQTGLDLINGFTETRNFFVARIEGSLYIIITVIAIALSFTISVAGKSLLNLIDRYLPHISYSLNFYINYKYLLGWSILTLVFALLYAFLPGRKQSFKSQIPGAALCSIGWNLFSMLFSFYLQNFGSFNLYGSLSTIIIVLMWLYACMYMFFFGAYVNLLYKGDIYQILKRISHHHTA